MPSQTVVVQKLQRSTNQCTHDCVFKCSFTVRSKEGLEVVVNTCTLAKVKGVCVCVCVCVCVSDCVYCVLYWWVCVCIVCMCVCVLSECVVKGACVTVRTCGLLAGACAHICKSVCLGWPGAHMSGMYSCTALQACHIQHTHTHMYRHNIHVHTRTCMHTHTTHIKHRLLVHTRVLHCMHW